MDELCLIAPDGAVLLPGPAGAVPWWSFTKTVLAAAALKLVETGALALDAPLSPAPYSLRQLLRHEAGVAEYGALAAYHAAVAVGEPPWSRAELLARLDADRLLFAPGAGWAYSNVGYMWVAELVAQAAGRPLGEALRTLVFDPADAPGARLALLPSDLVDVRMGAAAGYHPGWVYHGLVVGPPVDAARVLRALLTGRLIGPQTLDQMREVRPLPQFHSERWPDPAYGLGLMAPGVGGGERLFGHTGGGPGSGFAAYARPTPQGPIVAAVWADSDAQAEAAVIGRLSEGLAPSARL